LYGTNDQNLARKIFQTCDIWADMWKKKSRVFFRRNRYLPAGSLGLYVNLSTLSEYIHSFIYCFRFFTLNFESCRGAQSGHPDHQWSSYDEE
jgi:hypothetical protein